MTKSIAIIGGGAAGLMCAAAILKKKENFVIHLFEKNPSLGAKVIISGGGRCNVTTGITDLKILLSKYSRGAGFVKYALTKFPPKNVMTWFETHGVPLKVEDDLRVFPKSDSGRDIVGCFEKIFKQHEVTLHLAESVKSIKPIAGGNFRLVSNKANYEFNIVVITTGGNAYSHTGSSGDGYAFAKSCGHTITKLGPSLNSFLCSEDWPKKLSGLSLDNAQLSGKAEDGVMKSAIGPLLFTHFGISGPVTFALSSHLAFTTISKDSPIRVSLTPFAGRTSDEWDKLLREAIERHGKRQLNTVLSDFIPQRLSESILTLAGISPGRKSAEISKSERKEIVSYLTGKLTLDLIQRRPGDEFVTAGGVSLDEVDEKSMRSKLNPNLYFAGEVLDIDGLTGGFNLQSSWATGWLAGKCISGTLTDEY